MGSCIQREARFKARTTLSDPSNHLSTHFQDHVSAWHLTSTCGSDLSGCQNKGLELTKVTTNSSKDCLLCDSILWKVDPFDNPNATLVQRVWWPGLVHIYQPPHFAPKARPPLLLCKWRASILTWLDGMETKFCWTFTFNNTIWPTRHGFKLRVNVSTCLDGFSSMPRGSNRKQLITLSNFLLADDRLIWLLHFAPQRKGPATDCLWIHMSYRGEFCDSRYSISLVFTSGTETKEQCWWPPTRCFTFVLFPSSLRLVCIGLKALD